MYHLFALSIGMTLYSVSSQLVDDRFPPLLSTDVSAVDEQFTMADHSGQSLLCQWRLHADDISGATVLEDQKTFVKDDTCIPFEDGYWSYVICQGSTIVQFHRGAHGKLGTKHLIGRYQREERVVSLGKKTHSNRLRNEYYMDGDDCPDTGLPRRAEVVYSCCTPPSGAQTDVVRLEEQAPCRYVFHVCSKTECQSLPQESFSTVAQTAAQAGDLPTIMAPLHGKCFLLSEGWWNYEICVGNSIRQFHHDTSSGNKALNAVDEHYLGLSSAIPHYNLVVDKAADFEKLYVVTQYTEGSVCEEAAGLLRETEIRFYCPTILPKNLQHIPTQKALGTILSIEEYETCKYVVRIASTLVCRVPEAQQFKVPVFRLDCEPQAK